LIFSVPDKPREIITPGRVVVTLRGKKKKQPVIHTADRVAVKIKKLPTGKGILRVVSLTERGHLIEVLATYKPNEWKKAKVHRPKFKRRPEIAEAYRMQQAVATALAMNDAFGPNWNPAQVH
jgi:hypothetical protein